MNAYYDVAQFLALKDISPNAQRRVAIAVLSLALALLVALVAVSPVYGHHGTPGSGSLSAYVAANPELSVVHRILLANAVSDSSYLAANPELSAARRAAVSVDRIASASIARWHGMADYYRRMAIEDALARLDALAETDSELWTDLLVYDVNGRYDYGD
jgi:hypothetical protein